MVRKYSISVALCSLLGGGALLNAQEVQVLDDAVVSASGFAQEIKEAPATINVITKEDLKKKPYRDIGEAIADIPGVDVNIWGGKTAGHQITMRGIRGYTLILVDGHRQSVGAAVTPNGFTGFEGAFLPPMSAIERIEVIKGPMSTLYGSEALGGVVNIITKKVGDKWGASVTTEALFQSNSEYGNTYGVSVYGSGPLVKDTLGLTLRAREAYREGSDVSITTPDGKTSIKGQDEGPTRSNNYNVGAKLSWLINEQNTLIYDIDYSNGRYNNEKGQVGRLSGGYLDELEMDRLVTYLAHEGTYEYFNLDSSVQYNRITHDGRTVTDSKSPYYKKGRDIKGEDILANTKAVIPILDWNMLSVGAEYRFEKGTDYAIEKFPKLDQYSFAIFAEDEISILDNLNLTLGARYNKPENVDDNISPRAYLVWNATDELTLKGGVATGFKAPRVDEAIDGITGYSFQGQNPSYGSSDLKEETSINYELGAIYQAEKFYIGATGFMTTFKDKISSEDIGKGKPVPGGGVCTPIDKGNGCSRKINHGEVEYKGVEFSAGVVPVENLNLDLSYTYLDTEITESASKSSIGKPEADTLKHNLIAKASYKILDFTPWVKGQWRGDRYAGKTKSQNGYDMKYYNDVFLVDVGMGYEINDSWDLNLAVNNLFDKDFTDDYIGYESRGSMSYVNKYKKIEEGRRFWVSLTGSF